MPSFELVKKVNHLDKEFIISLIKDTIQKNEYDIDAFSVNENMQEISFAVSHKKFGSVTGGISFKKQSENKGHLITIVANTPEVRTFKYWFISFLLCVLSLGILTPFVIGYIIGDVWGRPNTEKRKENALQSFNRIFESVYIKAESPEEYKQTTVALQEKEQILVKENTSNIEKINSLEISEQWKEKFRLLDKAGKLKFTYENFKELSKKERLKIGFNIWGFLLGPFYYFAKGMWLKGFILTFFGLLFAAATGIGILLVPAIAGAYANYDFYRFKVHNDKMWWF